jgi:hypothetical protein
VVDFLKRGLPYREIHRLTGVSVTTIGRVARFLGTGNGGYALAMARLTEGRTGDTAPPKGAAGRSRRADATADSGAEEGRRVTSARRGEVNRHG